jgi:hypothetical protein
VSHLVHTRATMGVVNGRPRAVFTGDLEVRPVALRSNRSEDHLADINVRQFGAGRFPVSFQSQVRESRRAQP